jgi:excisionase family DNA binding protein
MNNEFFTIKEALQVLNISKPTLYRYLKAGKLKAVKRINKTMIVAASAHDLVKITPLN